MTTVHVYFFFIFLSTTLLAIYVCDGAGDRTQDLTHTQASALSLNWSHFHSPKGEFIFLSKIHTKSIFNLRFYLNFDSRCIYQIH